MKDGSNEIEIKTINNLKEKMDKLTFEYYQKKMTLKSCIWSLNKINEDLIYLKHCKWYSEIYEKN